MREVVVFERNAYNDSDDYAIKEDDFNDIMKNIEAVFEPCVFVGTVGRWNGTFQGYKYLPDLKDLRSAISGYDDIVIRQVGTRLNFTLIHHDGRHEMELRRLSDYGYNNRNNVSFDYFNEATLKYINRNTRNYGKI